MRGRKNYEVDNEKFNADAYRLIGDKYQIAWDILGWETEPDADTEWTGYEVRTGNVICRMRGDDQLFSYDPDDLEPIADTDFCHECGQIGCTHDGLDRSED